ncbi:MAG TPA: ATP-binding protein [Conexibacter sp.]|nr:ATP-binding protein [Conexibacter sp.]
MIESPTELTTVEIRPNVGMLGLLSSMNYKPWYALSELVDNALASFLASRDALASRGQTHVTVEIRIDRAAGVIEVVDDAAGIAAADVARAFRPAEPPPDRSGLAQFGIGMKSAACWFSDHFTVTSTALAEPTRRSVEFDVPTIIAQELEQLPITVESADADAHATTVRLDRLHRPVPSRKTLGKIRKYLASIYRTFLRSGELVLIIGEERLEAREIEVLRASRWDAPAGARQRRWRKQVKLDLGDGCTVHGWLALRSRGSTSESGLALMHRGKVVVGAGSGAGAAEDLYRPSEIFGASTSFVFQRLVGELDVSGLRVTASKDAILWDGREAAFLEQLRAAADAEPLPLLRMARLHRSTERGPEVDRQLQSAIEATAAAVQHDQPLGADAQGPPADRLREAITRTLRWSAPAAVGEVALSVVLRDGSTWLSVWEADDGGWVIELDREHPFMQAFAHLPNQQIEPVLRLTTAIGLAEIQARLAGAREPSAVRMCLNDVLRGPLARTTVGAS